MATNEETNAAGTDTRPPMLVENDYESWKIRIHRKKLDSEFNDEENKLEMADTQAEIIPSGLPRHKILQPYSNLQALQRRIGIMWKCLCKESGSELFHKRKEDPVLSEYEPFGAIGNESFHDYFNMDISTTPYVQIYTHLKAYEPHAKKTLKKQEQSTSIVDPLAYVAHTTSAPVLSSSSTSSPQPTAQSPNDALMATMTQIANH
ncbi:hypothetical protein Tco_1464723 [Tanacetum coccineum]|uniref:Uncharacterized protein n=1 Tax=Tanacetum coccineum TaxID=301880 RepID=A0ABQ5FCZ7_9ASTR